MLTFDFFLVLIVVGVSGGVLLSWPKFSPLRRCAVNPVHGQYCGAMSTTVLYCTMFGCVDNDGKVAC